MKLRIKGNSIRLRLSQAEVDTMRSDGKIIIETNISPSDKFTYYIEAVKDEKINVELGDRSMKINVPKGIISNWVNTDEVGFQTRLSNGTEEGLTILVEKDFQCLKPRLHEDESDLFPNPQALHS